VTTRIFILLLCLPGVAFAGSLGNDVWKEVLAEEGGLARVDVLVRHRDELAGVDLAPEEGRRLAAAVMEGFAWREEYVDRLHQSDLFAVKDRVMENDLRCLTPLFVLWLEHPHPYVRLHGTGRLADLRAAEHAAVVADRLSDADPRVRTGAASALLAFDAKDRADAVAALIEDPEENVRRHALTVVGGLRGRAAAGEIAKALDDASARVRMRAATVLERVGARKTLPALRAAAGRAASETERRVFAGAIRNLETLRGERREVEVLRRFSGADSRVTKREIRLVRSAKDWTELWGRHSLEPSPPVDFGEETVVAILLGRAWNSRGVTARVTGDDERIRVRFDELSYQTMGGGDRVTPFGFFVIARSAKPVVVEENVQGLIGGEPVWAERARLNP